MHLTQIRCKYVILVRVLLKLKLMKKFSLIGSSALFALVITFLFMACQKEQSQSTTDVPSGSESAVIHGGAVNGPFEGSINSSYAASLQQNFAKKYDDDDQTLRVAFSAKDLSAFIASLQKKYQSDIIYVNFGLYGKGAPAPDPKDNGRMTVFFTGNNMPTTSAGAPRGNGVDASSDDYLNHGNIYP